MKITIISNYFYPEIGAASKRITDMAMGLKAAGNEIEVVCPLPNYPQGKIFEGYRGKFFRKEDYKGITVRRYWISPSVSKNPLLRVWSMFSFAFNLIFETWHFIKQKPHCIIIQNSPLFVSFMGIVVSKASRRSKIVLNISDLWPLSALELGAIKKGFFYSLLERVERFNYRHSDLIVGQSEEIIEHASAIVHKPSFLYRNLSFNKASGYVQTTERKPLRIVYAGLLGVAQGVLDIVQQVDFKKLGAEMHIYGNGNETAKIVEYINTHPKNGVFFHGSLPHKEMMETLPTFHASLVPLRTHIKGAVPSKIFEMASVGVPVLFSGGGEGEKIVKTMYLGLASPPDDMKALEDNIAKMVLFNDGEYAKLRQSCLDAASTHFDFQKQMERLCLELEKVVRR